MELKELQENYAQTGTVVAISVRSKRLEAASKVNEVLALEGRGLEGDHLRP